MTALLDMNPLPAQSEPVERPKAAMRFAYSSGSRPLEGYTIKRGVGRGGFGEVYFAVSDAGKEVALKLIRRNLEVEIRGVTQCLNLKHPNLVSVYDIRTDEHDDHWVVMEFVSGASLEDVIDRYPAGMPRDMALHWFEGICSAVAYLHDHGIVHRDLKPANIFLDEGRVKIGDYGLSKFISCSRRSGQTESVGTVHYMAPEIANGRYGREIDSYALGIILYEMLTGRVPFEGESVGEVLMKHLTAEPDLGGLEEPYLSVVRGAMAKDPERRINDAAAMIAMLSGEQAVSAVAGRPFVAPAAYAPEAPATPASSPLGGAAQSRPEPARTYAPRPPAPPLFPPGEEPVQAAVRNAFRNLAANVRWSQWHPFHKVLAGIPLAFILISTSELWLAMVMPLGFIYIAYRMVRSVVLHAQAQAIQATPPSSPPPTRVAPQAWAPAAQPAATESRRPLAATRPWRRRQASWTAAAHAYLAARPNRERSSELVGAMIVSAGVSAFAALFIQFFAGPQADAGLYLWSLVTATAGSWAILIPAKLTEGRVEDQTPLRFMQLVAGALVGGVAWLAADAALLKMPLAHDATVSPQDTPFIGLFNGQFGDLQQQYNAGAVQLPPAAFMAYFAFLFVILRWWRQAEWTRASRVSIWTVAWCGFIAWLTGLLWWFPQPLGVLLAAAMSLSIQLASPWCPPSKRRQLAEAAVA